jgi:histidine ammonia-lyase
MAFTPWLKAFKLAKLADIIGAVSLEAIRWSYDPFSMKIFRMFGGRIKDKLNGPCFPKNT